MSKYVLPWAENVIVYVFKNSISTFNTIMWIMYQLNMWY